MAKVSPPDPSVRYQILCENWRVDEQRPQRVSIDGLISNLHSLDDPPYPLLLEELCVFLAITEGRGQGTGRIICTFEETGDVAFETDARRIEFGADPLEVVGIAFRIRDCWFPKSGRYSVEFWYNGREISRRPLLMR